MRTRDRGFDRLRLRLSNTVRFSLETCAHNVEQKLTENLERVRIQAHSLVHMLKQTAGCCDKDVHPRKASLFFLQGFTADDQTRRERVVGPNLAEDFEDLYSLRTAEQTYQYRREKLQGSY